MQHMTDDELWEVVESNKYGYLYRDMAILELYNRGLLS